MLKGVSARSCSKSKALALLTSAIWCVDKQRCRAANDRKGPCQNLWPSPMLFLMVRRISMRSDTLFYRPWLLMASTCWQESRGAGHLITWNPRGGNSHCRPSPLQALLPLIMTPSYVRAGGLLLREAWHLDAGFWWQIGLLRVFEKQKNSKIQLRH